MGWFLILAFLGVTALQYLLNRGNKSKAQQPGILEPPRAAAGTPIPVFFGTVKVEPIIVAFSVDKVRKLEKPVGFLPAPFQEKQFLGWDYTISFMGLLGWGPTTLWKDLLFDETKLFSQEPNNVGVVTVADGSVGGMDPSTLTATITGKGTLSGQASILLPFVFGGDPPEGQRGIGDGRDYSVSGHQRLTSGPAHVFFFPGNSGQVAPFTYPEAVDTYVSAYAPVGEPFSFVPQPRYNRFCYTYFDWVSVGTAPQLHKIEHVVKGAIGGDGGEDNLDANPARVLATILTDQEWGLGVSEALIDLSNFNDASIAIDAEDFGISGVMNQQKPAEDYINEILRTIDAALYRDPETGKFCIQFIRGGYSIPALSPLNETNTIACEWTRRDVGDTVNQVVIAFTDRRWMFERNTVTLTDHANVAATGSVRSQTMEFPWVSTDVRALKVGARELKAATLPLGKGTLIVDRDSWDSVPGDVRRLSWARYGLVDVPVRVLSMSAGTVEDGSIDIEVVEDVYGQPDVPYTVAGDPPSTVGTASPDASTPVVQQYPSQTATTGSLTLVVIDPETLVTEVAFSTQSGNATATSFVADASLPYSTVVTLDPGAQSYINWRVTWIDALSVSRTITGSVPYSATNPNLDDIKDVNATAPSDGNVLTWDAATGKWVPRAPGGGLPAGTGYIHVTAGVADTPSDTVGPTHLGSGSPDATTFLRGDGSWQPLSASGLASRATVTKTTASLANNATENSTVTLSKSSDLDSIQVDHACRVVFYSTSAARTSDASRALGVFATPGRGILAEFAFVAAGTIDASPVPTLKNGDGSPSTSIYYALTNLSGATNTVTLTLIHLPLEA